MKPSDIVFGIILPVIRKRRIPLNRDGSIVDTGEADLFDEKGYYYVNPWVVEWIGLGFPISKSLVYLSATNEVAELPFEGKAGRA